MCNLFVYIMHVLVKYIFIFCRQEPLTCAEPNVNAADDVGNTPTPGPAPADHDYACRPAQVSEQLEAARKRIAELEHALQLEKQKQFSLSRFAGSDAKVKKYTGFKDSKTFEAVFSVLQPTAEKMVRWTQMTRQKDISKCAVNPFRCETLPLQDQFFLFMARVRANLDEEVLGDLFGISQPTVSRCLTTWANYLYSVLASVAVWPSREAVQRRMPAVFKPDYASCRVILDCTEIRVQTPSSKVLNSMSYSHYKGCTTYKSLVGISPCGAVTFVSTLFTGSVSDKDICVRSGFIDLLDENDQVMADKGFTIQDLLVKKKASLVIPPFLGEAPQFRASEVILTQDIARLRVHVERAIRRVKEFKIFQNMIPLSIAGTISQIWTVCVLLTNFRGPLF